MYLEIVELINIFCHSLPRPLEDIILAERFRCLLLAPRDVHRDEELHVLAALPGKVLDGEQEHVRVGLGSANRRPSGPVLGTHLYQTRSDGKVSRTKIDTLCCW